MERSTALQMGLPQYETGRPCKNGHVDARYTSSGACVVCVRDAARGVRRAPLPQPLVTSVDPSVLVSQNFSCRVENLSVLEATVRMMVALRYPDMPRSWYCQRSNPTHTSGGVSRYLMKAHPDDIPALLAFQSSLFDTPEMRARIAATHAKVAALVPQGDPFPIPPELRGHQ
jgi:hypothetical protein